MSGATPLQAVDLQPGQKSDLAWRIRAVGDYNGDGHPDLIWENNSTGDVYAWFLNGIVRIDEGPLNPGRVKPVGQVVGPKQRRKRKRPGWRSPTGPFIVRFEARISNSELLTSNF